MRVEPHSVGSYVHVIKRGARGMPITGDSLDQQRFLRVLYYMNDTHFDENWDHAKGAKNFARPDTWPTRDPLVELLAYTLMPNHIHLLVREVKEKGVSTYMKKVGQSMTNHHNEKYKEHGSLFQGAYKGRTIRSDTHLHYVSSYIMVKNVFELYPDGGLGAAVNDLEHAWEWALQYPYSSLSHYATKKLPIIDRNILEEVFPTSASFRSFSRAVIEGGKWLDTDHE